MLTDSQIAIRKNGLGGSDVAAVCGVHPYRSALDVYLDKIGEGTQPDDGPDTAIWWGNALEDDIAAWYSEKTGRVLMEGTTLIKPEKQWFIASPDRLVIDERVGLEIKAPRSYPQRKRWGRAGSDNVPPECLVQCHWYMEFFGYPEWDVAALVIRDPRIYTIREDRVFQRNLLELAERFWTENVLGRTPPAADNAEGVFDL